MVQTTDYDFIVALSRKLSDDDSLFQKVNGKMEIEYPLKNVAANLNGTNKTMVSVSAPNIVSKAAMGYDDSGLVHSSAMLQIDVASLKGNNSSYCREVANDIKCLIEGDITITVGGIQYNIYVDRVNDNLYYDEDIGCWHSAMIIYAEYIKNSK